MKSLEIQRLSFLGFAHFAALLVGIYAVHLETASTQRGIWMLNWGIGFALVLACAADAKIRKRPVVRIVQFLMLLFWPLEHSYSTCSVYPQCRMQLQASVVVTSSSTDCIADHS